MQSVYNDTVKYYKSILKRIESGPCLSHFSGLTCLPQTLGTWGKLPSSLEAPLTRPVARRGDRTTKQCPSPPVPSPASPLACVGSQPRLPSPCVSCLAGCRGPEPQPRWKGLRVRSTEHSAQLPCDLGPSGLRSVNTLLPRGEH